MFTFVDICIRIINKHLITLKINWFVSLFDCLLPNESLCNKTLCNKALSLTLLKNSKKYYLKTVSRLLETYIGLPTDDNK